MLIAFVGYVAWRLREGANRARIWGLVPLLPTRLRGTYGAALGVGAALALVVAEPAAVSQAPTAGLALAEVPLYLVYGIAQQFALQNFVDRPVRTWISSRGISAGITAALFALAHSPRWDLVAFCAVGGLALTLLHRHHGNLWLTGLVHGSVGSVLFAHGWID